jgi:hypothetical protein
MARKVWYNIESFIDTYIIKRRLILHENAFSYGSFVKFEMFSSDGFTYAVLLV